MLVSKMMRSVCPKVVKHKSEAEAVEGKLI